MNILAAILRLVLDAQETVGQITISGEELVF